MAMLDRAWLPRIAVEHEFDWKPANSPTKIERAAAPVGFPQAINAEMVWEGEVFQGQPDLYRYELTKRHVQELEDAAMAVEAQGLPLGQLCPENFCLATLGPVLRRLARDVAHGRGFFAFRGLDPSRYSKSRNIVIYVGIASYVGNRCGRQDEHGNMLLHLTDLGSTAAPDNERQAPYSSVGQPFHTDTGSILGLYALEKATYGGESKIASSWYIYNQLQRLRPDLVRALAESDWIFDTFGQNPPYRTRPLIHVEDGKVVFSFSRRPLLGSATSPRSKGVPDLSNMQVEALNMIQLLAEEYALVIDLGPGDMLFWNNLGLLHARNGFTDSHCRRRHLVRIWLHNDDLGWAIPQRIREPWRDAFEHDGRQQLWPMEPITDRTYITTQQRSSGHS